MKTKCNNHPEKDSISICHSCGESYCIDCLQEGSTYYYCRKPNCHSLFLKENNVTDIYCKKCGKYYPLKEVTLYDVKYYCPHCGNMTLENNLCDICKNNSDGYWGEFIYGIEKDIRTSYAPTLVGIQAKTTTKYLILGKEKAFICNACIKRKRSSSLKSIFITLLVGVLILSPVLYFVELLKGSISSAILMIVLLILLASIWTVIKEANKDYYQLGNRDANQFSDAVDHMAIDVVSPNVTNSLKIEKLVMFSRFEYNKLT
jgi:hypothetical protein